MADIPPHEPPQASPGDDFDVIEVLSQRLLESRSFGEAVVSLRTARLREIARGDVEEVPIELVRRLASAASILASSRNPSNRKLAYTIATDLHLVTRNSNLSFDAGLRVILSRIGNFPAISTDERVEAALANRSHFALLPTSFLLPLTGQSSSVRYTRYLPIISTTFGRSSPRTAAQQSQLQRRLEKASFCKRT